MPQRKKVNRRTSTERTAHHEAAHAVASYRLRPNAVREGVTIVPTKDTLGHHSAEDVQDSGLRHSSTGELYVDPKEIEAQVVVLLAGDVGARRAGSPARRGTGSDYAKAADLARGTRKPLATFSRRAARFVEREWAAVSAVARELLDRETLDSTEVELIVDLVGQPAEMRAALARYRLMARIV